MLQVDPKKRFKLDDVKGHRWLASLNSQVPCSRNLSIEISESSAKLLLRALSAPSAASPVSVRKHHRHASFESRTCLQKRSCASSLASRRNSNPSAYPSSRPYTESAALLTACV